MVTFTLTARGPFSLAASTRFLEGFTPAGYTGAADPVVAGLQHRYPGLRPVGFWSPYEAAAWAIISQRIRIRQAATVKARMSEQLGEPVSTPASCGPSRTRKH
jgi:3-methyladenine DNA glycosylase/8-oxoguanine DNA glycosylase